MPAAINSKVVIMGYCLGVIKNGFVAYIIFFKYTYRF